MTARPFTLDAGAILISAVASIAGALAAAAIADAGAIIGAFAGSIVGDVSAEGLKSGIARVRGTADSDAPAAPAAPAGESGILAKSAESAATTAAAQATTAGFNLGREAATVAIGLIMGGTALTGAEVATGESFIQGGRETTLFGNALTRPPPEPPTTGVTGPTGPVAEECRPQAEAVDIPAANPSAEATVFVAGEDCPPIAITAATADPSASFTASTACTEVAPGAPCPVSVSVTTPPPPGETLTGTILVTFVPPGSDAAEQLAIQVTASG